jgi:hypothetical protein
MLSIEFLRNFLPVGKDFTIPVANFLPVGNGSAKRADSGDKTSASPGTPGTKVVRPFMVNVICIEGAVLCLSAPQLVTRRLAHALV